MKESDKVRSTVFKFKQFEVDQRDCPMKINTDGVLLGALAGNHASMRKEDSEWRVLDIGTGTGVIALMLAQRFRDAVVDAIEIDAAAARRAGANFLNSPFADRLSVHHVALEDFTADSHRYDLIVSNPPFFLDSLTNPDQRKRVARHTDFHFYQTLLARTSEWLQLEGRLQLILPPVLAGQVAQVAVNYGLRIEGSTAIYSFSDDTNPVRMMISWIRDIEPSAAQEAERFMIYASRGKYSAAYRQVLKDFFLDF